MNIWKITGLVATIVIVLSLPSYLLKEYYVRTLAGPAKPERVATFVGREKCKSCHKKEYDKWLNSDHDKAMDVANEDTVLGDFNNAVFEDDGITSRFYRKDKKFFVNTQGPDGKMGDFEIAYTFGVKPLQQYLVPFPGGRLQCLNIAWDVEKKKWYRLPPYDVKGPDDWLHWTKAGQNWNIMCADCHSTHLQKGYDPKSGTYKTTWSEIDVSCEACHGPGSLHVEWADKPPMARTETDGYELVVQTGDMDSERQVQLCARCHARRSMLGDYSHFEDDMMDNLVPELLNEPLYYPDGQILEEDYVYGSFVQSKMYHNNVRCSDCHEIHSVKPVKEGNELCLQCHRADTYDTKDHHFHKKKGEKGEPVKSSTGEVLSEVGEGAECVRCHMPGRYYMGIDYRPDHSIRIPRPDLSIKLGFTDSCSRCHKDKPIEWSSDNATKWYGLSRKPHYGTVLAAGRKGTPKAGADLIKLAGDQLFPVIVRATALSLLSSYPGEESTLAFKQALGDEQALIRHTAARYFSCPDPGELVKLMAPMLYDPVKAVRTQAAMNLTVIPAEQLNTGQRKAFQAALLEYQKSMEYSADFSAGRHSLGNMYSNLGQLEKAEENYKAAIQIDDAFYPAKVNLAMLYNHMGKNDKAEFLLREVVKAHPELYETAYSLGLLLAEKKEYAEAAVYLEAAAKGLPDHSRIHYNLGLLFQYLERPSEAEVALLRALEIEPDNMDFLYAAADHYIKRKKFREAKQIAQQMIKKYPDAAIGYDLLSFTNRNLQKPSGP